MSAAGPPQGANLAPSGGSAAAKAASVGAHHTSGALHIDSSGDGPSLVLLHGWAMHSGLWGPLVPRLAQRYRVHAVDLPGHGHSPAPNEFTLDGCVAAVAAALAAGEPPHTVLGWSLGGLVAMRWALLEPAMVGRVALVCTSPRFVAGVDWPHAMSRETLARFGDELDVALKPALQRFLALQLRGSEHGRATLAAMRRAIFARGEPSPAALRGALVALAGTDLRAEIGAIAQPVLVVSGSRDTLAPADAGRWLAHRLARARFVPIADAAHVPFLSHAGAFNAALDRFLDAA